MKGNVDLRCAWILPAKVDHADRGVVQMSTSAAVAGGNHPSVGDGDPVGVNLRGWYHLVLLEADNLGASCHKDMRASSLAVLVLDGPEEVVVGSSAAARPTHLWHGWEHASRLSSSSCPTSARTMAKAAKYLKYLNTCEEARAPRVDYQGHKDPHDRVKEVLPVSPDEGVTKNTNDPSLAEQLCPDETHRCGEPSQEVQSPVTEGARFCLWSRLGAGCSGDLVKGLSIHIPLGNVRLIPIQVTKHRPVPFFECVRPPSRSSRHGSGKDPETLP